MADENEAHRDLVRESYDAIAHTYLAWATAKVENSRFSHIKQILKALPNPADASVLELGCGAGVPGTQRLAAAVRQVVANDISSTQVELARTYVKAPNVEFVAGDMMKLHYEPGTFDAVTAFYSIIHLPREEQKVMIDRLVSWLKPHGYFLCNLAVHDDPGGTHEWLGGQKMYWSSFSADTNRRIVQEAGFDLVYADVHEETEDGQPIPFLWILAKKSERV